MLSVFGMQAGFVDVNKADAHGSAVTGCPISKLIFPTDHFTAKRNLVMTVAVGESVPSGERSDLILFLVASRKPLDRYSGADL